MHTSMHHGYIIIDDSAKNDVHEECSDAAGDEKRIDVVAEASQDVSGAVPK